MAIATRLTNTGALLVNGNFDENTSIAPAKFSTTANTAYAGTLDEVTMSSGAAVFNGTSQSLSVASNAAFAMNAGDFTLECWVYPRASNVAQAIFDMRTPNSVLGWDLYISSTGPSFRFGTTGTNWLVSNFSTLNIWYHLAVVRSGTALSLYVNGTSASTFTLTSQNWTNNTPTVGGGVNGFFNGYISNLRLVKGTALYTTNFTPSQSVLPAVSGTSLLLNTLTSTNFTTDTSSNAFTVTNNGATTYTTVNPFLNSSTTIKQRQFTDGTLQVYTEFDEVTLASGSMAFNGTNQFVSVPSNAAFAFGTGDFTIECWWYATTTTGINVFDSRTTQTGNGININCTGATLAPQYRPLGVTQITGSALNLNTWYHIAVVRSSAVTTIYVNGVQSGPTYADTVNFNNAPARTGANYNSGGLSTGYISNLRVTKAAVYTSTFTPPQQILPALSSTTWLLNVLNSDNLITDNSTNNFTATNNGTVAWDATGPFNA